MEPSGTREPDLIDPDDPTGLREAARAMTRLADSLDRVDRRSRSQTIIIALLVVVAILNAAVAIGNRSIAGTIEDCITPAGRCYQESRQRGSEIQRSVIEQQHEDAERTLTAVCSFIAQHDLEMPVECTSVAPFPPTTR